MGCCADADVDLKRLAWNAELEAAGRKAEEEVEV